MHRSGALSEAVAVYRDRTSVDSMSPVLRYNLGTALLGLEGAETGRELSRATTSPEPDVRASAFYNLGLWSLSRAIVTDGDSARAHAAASAAASRSALRIRADDPDAKWNLAMAQRLLDSIDAAERRAGMEASDGAQTTDAVVTSENMDSAQEEEVSGDIPTEGEDEALADAGEETPLSLAEAIEILGVTHRDATLIVEKMLGLESRARWGRQLGRVGRRW
jgi:hypothetical protein